MDFPTVLLSPSDTLCTVVGVGFFVHLIFKQTETRQPFWLFVLLFAIPGCLTFFYLTHAGSTILAVTKVFGLFWSTLTTSILVYRVSPWHPLAKYPGPILCKLTKFYLAYCNLGGKQYLYYSKLHRKFGDVVRIGPNELSIRNVDFVYPLLGPNGLQKGPVWSGRLPEYDKITVLDDQDNETKRRPEAVKSLISILDKKEHTRRRQPWARSFSTSALKGYESLLVKRTLQLVEVILSKNLDEAIDLKKWIQYFGYDAMTDVSFGGGSEMMREGDTVGILGILANAQRDVTFLSHVPWLGAMILSYPELIPAYNKFRAYAQERAMHRLKAGSPYQDIFYHLLNEDDVGTYRPSVAEVISDSDLAIVAGSETTTNTITNALYFLMINPTPYKRLRAEIDGLGDNVVDCAAHVHLPYLNAVLRESLRLLPPVLSGGQRAAEKGTGGRVVGSVFLPEGTSAFIHTYSLQRDPRYFSPLPDSFLPERWLSEEQRLVLEPEIFKSDQNYVNNTAAFIPFSFGPANCPGQNLAWMEMRLAVSIIISRFDLKLDPSYDPQKWHEDVCDYFSMVTGSLPVLVSPRKSV